MAGQYDVLTEAMQKHARKVAGFADRLALAVDAAQRVSLPTDAYGVCCADLAMVLNSLQQLGVATLEEGGKRLSTTATSIHDTAEDYTAVDDHNALALCRAVRIR